MDTNWLNDFVLTSGYSSLNFQSQETFFKRKALNDSVFLQHAWSAGAKFVGEKSIVPESLK